MPRLTNLLTLAAGLFALGTASSLAQAPTRSPARTVPACDLGSAPEACGSCPALTTAISSVPSERLSTGPVVDGVHWTPLYVAQRLHCVDAGVALMRRGADPNIGGRDGALVAEIAKSAGENVLPAEALSRRQRAMDWLHRMGRYGLDLDAPLPGGSNNRRAWTTTPSENLAARAIWAYAASISASQPVLPDNTPPGNADRPGPDSGVTRPSETAVARGVEVYLATQRAGGMNGAIERIRNCWAAPRGAGLTRDQLRWSFEACAAVDVAAAQFQEAFNREIRRDATPDFLRPYEQEQRLQVFRQFATEGLVPSVHRRGLERSVQAWLGVVSASEPPRTVAPSVLGLRSVSPSGPVSAAVLQEPAMQPTYPEVARRTGDSGTVVLTLRISEEGRVVTVDVERSSGFGALDNAARLTAFQWRFRAAQRDGVEVISFQRVMATFSTGAPGPRTTMRAVQG